VKYTSQGDDPNHFHSAYFGKGKVWHDPKLKRVLMNYEMAKSVYEESGRNIINESVGGKLEVFDRIDYITFFSEPSAIISRRIPRNFGHDFILSDFSNLHSSVQS